jgi:galactokinase
MSLVNDIRKVFKEQFGSKVPRLFRAPGRVNLIGEHTDYSDGFVLPVAINFQIVVAAALREDKQVNIYAADFKQSDSFDIEDIAPYSKISWPNYIRGMCDVLIKEGNAPKGFDAVVSGNVPIGSGLSSSAAIEVALGYAYLKLVGNGANRVALAKAAQKAENDFVGMQCGIMDQFIACLGKNDHALLIDCRDLSYQSVYLPSDVSIVIVDSGIQRKLVEAEYNNRREECERAAECLGVTILREADSDLLEQQGKHLSGIEYHRARHVITENARTLEAVQCLQKGDFANFGQLMVASHQSLKNDFEVSLPELDYLVETAMTVDGVYGARLTGAGFGGCVIALVRNEAVMDLTNEIQRRYQNKTGLKEKIYICHASEGASEITDQMYEGEVQ